jgi:cargo-transport protein YPP1
VLPWLTAPAQPALSSPQFLHWSEKLLAKSALLASEEAYEAGSVPSREAIEIALKSFRIWSYHPVIKRTELSSLSQATGPAEPALQLPTWMAYYKLLSAIVQRGMFYTPPSEGSARTQLSNEIRRVEAICEAVLLSEVKFPRANAGCPQIESWVEQVIHNWEVLCGPDWRDEDLGEGGQNALSRNVLDVSFLF